MQLVNVAVVQQLMEEIGGEELIHFILVEYAVRAQLVSNTLGVSKLTFENIWQVFSMMIPQLYN